MKEIARILIVAGGSLVIGGLVIYFLGDRLKGFGHLPGDIRVEKPGFSFYMPLTSMLLVSAVLSMVVWLVRKLF